MSHQRFDNGAQSGAGRSGLPLANVIPETEATHTLHPHVSLTPKQDPVPVSFQYASQTHSPPMMWTSVSRTERKLPPRSRVNCSALSSETACKTLLFAQRSYS